MDFGLNEGDVITIFSQYGEIIDVKLARNKEVSLALSINAFRMGNHEDSLS
jgi:hypothetical protein